MANRITIYTDGACSGNPGPGGWSAILVAGAVRKEISGGDPDTTNNRMERGSFPALPESRTSQKPSRR